MYPSSCTYQSLRTSIRIHEEEFYPLSCSSVLFQIEKQFFFQNILPCRSVRIISYSQHQISTYILFSSSIWIRHGRLFHGCDFGKHISLCASSGSHIKLITSAWVTKRNSEFIKYLNLRIISWLPQWLHMCLFSCWREYVCIC